MTARGRLLDRIPARVSMRIRAEPGVRRLLGLHRPSELVIDLVPRGRNAIDAGANRGIYAYWMGQRAAMVDAFEPQPRLAAYIRDARLRNVRVHEVALSDRPGMAELLIPGDDGLAHLSGAGAAPPALQPGMESGSGLAIQVETAALDSFDLRDIGFLKIDVEGHELAVLDGAERTITASRPIVFVESEARHARGAPGNVADRMLGHHGYRRAAFVRDWGLVDLDAFDLERDQLSLLPDFMHPSYVSNFVFWP